MSKRGYIGTYHHFTKKYLHRYVDEFFGCHSVLILDSGEQLALLV